MQRMRRTRVGVRPAEDTSRSYRTAADRAGSWRSPVGVPPDDLHRIRRCRLKIHLERRSVADPSTCRLRRGASGTGPQGPRSRRRLPPDRARSPGSRTARSRAYSS
uniref:(northern house mosquito) hypothetical protein n=1 Tax=Culex pipiens TaxID=7175 RepID=A0A8D8CL95_CULPI